MKARTNLLIVFVGAIFVLATVSHGYAAQTPSGQGRTDQQNQSGNNPNVSPSGPENQQKSMTNDAGSQGETPRTGNTQQPIIIRHVGWSWLLISGLIGFVIGRLTTPRGPYRRDQDIRRDRTA